MVSKKDLFVLNECFPDAAAVFSAQYKHLEEIKEICIVSLDATVLLAPYAIGKKGLAALQRAYGQLTASNRLIITGQVAREFARHRAGKLGEIVKSLEDQSSRAVAPIREAIEFLKSVSAYEEALKLSDEIGKLSRQLNKEIARVVEEISSWRSEDPVSLLYRQLFSKVVVDISLDDREREDFTTELQFRYDNKIPPGYRDNGKLDSGSGDLILWKTLLKVGQEKKQDLLLVTGDEKNDWWTRTAGRTLQPRYELVDEYRRASGGCTFHLSLFSDFLRNFGVEPDVVKEIEKVETKNAEQGQATRVADGRTSSVWPGHIDELLRELPERSRMLLEKYAIEARIRRLEARLAGIPQDANQSLSLPWNRDAHAVRIRLGEEQDRLVELEQQIAAVDERDKI